VTIILDAGPIVAILNKNDPYHQWAQEQAAQLRGPFLTCESVLTEATLLLRNYPHAVRKVMDRVADKTFQLSFDLSEQLQPVSELMAKYEDIGMSLADACLVRMTELQPEAVIFSTDSDFGIYRRLKRQPIQTLLPD